MNSLFQGFFNAVKARMISVWTKIRLFTNPTYLKGEVLRRLIEYFRQMTDVRPRDKNDYYSIFGWLVSKRLAFFIVVLIGMVSAYYVTVVQPLSVFTSGENGIKTYAYNSVPLRFTEGRVRIKAKSDYVAYEGMVAKGMAVGDGTLYRNDGSKVYVGQFENSKFQGTGTQYYPNGQLQYTGGFSQNLYHGNGKLYRQNGSMEYEGSFLDGMKEGEGTLYDGSNNEIFVGNFSKDQLLYSDFVGKSTVEANSMYPGMKMVYTDDEYFVVEMSDIDALYYGIQQEDSLTDEIIIEGIYILKNTFECFGETLESISEVTQILGNPVYEGNANIIMPEAVAIRNLRRNADAFYGDAIKGVEQILSDAAIVTELDEDYVVYIYSYEQEGLRYTFYGKDKSGKFSMYLIEKSE